MANNNITLAEKLGVIPHLAIGLFHGSLRLATRTFGTSDGRPPTAYKDFIYATLRHLLSNVSVKQEKWLSPPTDTVYLNFARDKNFQPDTDVLPSGVKVHWVGNKSAEKVFLYFHGGGYVNAISPAHLEWLLELSTDLSKSKRVAVAVLSYTCSPEGQYPLQLQQGTESLLWLMETQGKKPEDIFIGGDSAGGNLALGLMSHILHPHPNFQDTLRINLSSPLAGAILTSPWCKFPFEDESAFRNEGSDFVCRVGGERWSSAFMGTAQPDNYNQPYLASADWFSGLDKVVKGVFVWGGAHEVLVDSIDDIARKLKASFPETVYVRTPGAAHVGWLSHKLIGIKGKEESTNAIESFMADRL